MSVEIRKAISKEDRELLCRMDKQMFPKGDVYDKPSYWKEYDCYFLLLDGKPIGSIAFKPHTAPNGENEFIPSDDCLYITSTGILPRFQGRGWGAFLKAWEIVYARHCGFKRVLSHVRKSNTRIIKLNQKFGFRVVREMPNYYTDPREDGLLMELFFLN